VAALFHILSGKIDELNILPKLNEQWHISGCSICCFMLVAGALIVGASSYFTDDHAMV